MVHTLIITIPDCNDCRIQNVFDSSIYNESFSITNCILEVTPPGYDCPVIFNTDQGFNISLNPSNLHMVQGDSNGAYPSIPDGIYLFRYSVDPNTKIFVEASKLRTCKIMANYRESIRKLYQNDKRLTKDIFDNKVEQLSLIYFKIQAAKYMVDDELGERNEALALYNDAFKLLKNYNTCDRC